ncbi:MAG: hypothetical protein WAU39_03345 [Polyangiales bacterium]
MTAPSNGSRRVTLGLCVLVPLCLWSLGLLRVPRFMSDDFIFIVDNHASWLSVWTRDSYQAAGFDGAPAVVYRPLGVALLSSLRGVLGTSSPLPYRALALVLHALNAGLLALWLSRLGLRVRAAAAAAALWAVMPIHAEALGWAVALFDVASSSALLGALTLTASRGTGLRTTVVACFLGAVLIKESTLLGAFALWATLVASAGRPVRWNRIAWQTALLVSLCLGYLTVRQAVGVSPPIKLPFAFGALLTSLGEGFARAVGLAPYVPAAGSPLHSPTWLGLTSLIAVVALALVAVLVRARIMAPVLCLGAIAAGQILFGQSETGFLVDPDRYFYLTAAIVPVAAVTVATAASATKPSLKLPVPVLLFLFFGLFGFWSWAAAIAVADYDDFEHMLSREITIGRASGYVCFLRGIERLKRHDPCSAALDFERSAALEPNPDRRQQAYEFAARARRACHASRSLFGHAPSGRRCGLPCVLCGDGEPYRVVHVCSRLERRRSPEPVPL